MKEKLRIHQRIEIEDWVNVRAIGDVTWDECGYGSYNGRMTFSNMRLELKFTLHSCFTVTERFLLGRMVRYVDSSCRPTELVQDSADLVRLSIEVTVMSNIDKGSVKYKSGSQSQNVHKRNVLEMKCDPSASWCQSYALDNSLEVDFINGTIVMKNETTNARQIDQPKNGFRNEPIKIYGGSSDLGDRATSAFVAYATLCGARTDPF